MKSARMNSKASPSTKWSRRLRNGAVTVAVAIAVYALLGFLVFPLAVKPKLEAQLTQRLGRQATLGRLEFNPFTLRARASDFALTDRDPARPFVRFVRLDLDVSAASLRYLAPVFDEVRIVRPQVDLVRNADESYSIDDLLRSEGSADAPTPQFSLNNIVVENGLISLDDRVHGRKLTVSSIGIGIPFLSSIVHDAKIHVTPSVDGLFDGARFMLAGDSTSPFAEAQEATLALDFDEVPLARYAEYASLPGGLKISDGALTTRLKLAFATERNVARTVSLSGTARIDKLAFVRKDGSPLLGARAVDVGLNKLDWLAQSVALDRVLIDAPQADVLRHADGTLELVSLAGGGAQATRPQARPWTFAVANLRVVDGTLQFADASVVPAFKATLSKIGVEGTRIASTGGPGELDVHVDTDVGASLDLHGQVDLMARTARGQFTSKALQIARLHPYYASAVNLEVRRGTLDVAGDFEAVAEKAGTAIRFKQGAASLADVEASLQRERDPLWRIARADLQGVVLDLPARRLTIDRVALAQASLGVVREANGTINFERLVRTAEHESPKAGAPAVPATGGGWNVVVHAVEADRIAATLDDRAVQPPVKLRVSDARVRVREISTARGSKSSVEVAARIGTKGRLRLEGTVAADPLLADCRIDATGIDLVSLRPYYDGRTNVVVTSGAAAARGRLTLTPRSGSTRVTYAGNVSIRDFDSLDRPTSQALMRWQSLSLTGVKAASEPFELAIDAIGMDRFYARVILHEDATLNLTRLLAPETAAKEAAASGPPRTVAGVSRKELAPPPERGDLPVTIGRIAVSNGELQYSDFFVKPNYTAHLTDVAGSVSALSSSQAGTLELTGRVEGTAPADLRGTLNPFARELQLDLIGKATDVDLPALTPYSMKYPGYGIQKGKLSLEVHYKIDDRKLAATNRLKLEQLTFGEHVDSPTATKLPVLLAVSLLKDRNGVIDLDLPIQGTLDDPQFSVWRVVVQIFVNLITKAVTAPFALLASIGGGGGEQLAYVEFAPGRAQLSPATVEKLGTLAKALNDRPALKLDAAGRAIPDVDREALKRAALERALRVEKQKLLAAEGESAPSLETLTIDAAEHAKLLEAAYRATDLPDKPRNVFGIAKKVPPEEMEAMLLASYTVDDNALAGLANRRAQAVKEWFAHEGAVAADRVFIVAPKLGSEGVKDPGAPTRVDFSIR